jgi:hypothetical protein
VTSAPEVFPSQSLAGLDGPARPLADLWADGPAVILFGHSGCDTTRFTLPYVDRLHRRRSAGGVAAVLQDEPEAARELKERLGLELPILLEPAPYPLAAALGLTVVPTLFQAAAGGRIEAAVAAFQREALERAAERLGVSGPLFTADDRAPATRPG